MQRADDLSTGVLDRIPPDAYWDSLRGQFEVECLAEMRRLSNARHNEFEARSLGVDASAATALLDRIANDGWIVRATRHHCPVCHIELTDAQAQDTTCIDSECRADFADNGGVVEERFYRRSLIPLRPVTWVVAIHGMKSHGAWQERLTWLVNITWGRAVPLAIYKYGYIVPGVIISKRRRNLKLKLRQEIAQYGAQLAVKGIYGAPDVIAHSFGTWLIGHLLLAELNRPASERLRLGRIVLVGSILRPDFDWARLQREGLVQEVLNHFGDADIIVPLAHYAIGDSGPSGRQGFMGRTAINVRAAGYSHDDLLSMAKTLPDTNGGLPEDVKRTFMGSALYKTWKPFFELPSVEIAPLTTEEKGGPQWSASPKVMQGPVFPWIIIPALLAPLLWALTLPFKMLDSLSRWVGLGAMGLWFLVVLYAAAAALSIIRNRFRLRRLSKA